MSNLITVNRFGKVLIWVWNRCIKKAAIPYEELDFHYPDWAFIITGCIFFGVVVGVTLLYFAFIKQWKSHATLTLLATQDLPTFGYNMIDPLKSWCWGSILFYPFKISRFS